MTLTRVSCQLLYTCSYVNAFIDHNSDFESNTKNDSNEDELQNINAKPNLTYSSSTEERTRKDLQEENDQRKMTVTMVVITCIIIV